MKSSWVATVSFGLGIALATIGTTAPAAPKAKSAAARDWAAVVAVTPDGGFRMGNPNAPLKLIEYGSLTCPHCAHFDRDGVPALLKYVRSGKLSYEMRNFVRDPYDMAAAMITRCAGPRYFFPLTRQIFATQDQWTARFSSLSAAQYDQLESLQTLPKLARIANIAGLDTLAVRYGVPPAKAKACLADSKAIDQLAEIRRVGTEKYGLTGTPSFVLNGKKVENASSWDALEPALKQAGG